MFKRVHFLSKKEAEKITDAANSQHRICISIGTPLNPNKKYQPARLSDQAWLEVMKLSFHDVDYAMPNRVVFSDLDSTAIFKLLKKHQNGDVTDVVVHCDAGISRSAAVAKFIAMIYSLDFPESYSVYNRYVFNTLSHLYSACSYGEGLMKADDLPGVVS